MVSNATLSAPFSLDTATVNTINANIHFIRSLTLGSGRASLCAVLFLFICCVQLTAQQPQNAQGGQSIPAAQSADVVASDHSNRWYTNLFVSGSIQTSIPVSLLKDYTEAKPGYRAAIGYTFFRAGKHTMPVYLEAGQSVILGTNPLVRSLDAFPVAVHAAYEYFPIPYFSVGAFAGAGIEFLRIRHYPVALDLLTNNLKISNGKDPIVTAGVLLGAAIFDRSIEVKALFSADIMIEKDRVVPMPSFQLAVRVYPGAVYAYTQKKQPVMVNVSTAPAEQADTQLPETPAAEEQATVQPAVQPIEQFSALYVYFEPESAELDVNAKGDIKKAAAILKEHQDLFILFESSTAPFGSQSGRIQLESARVLTVANYLKQKCGIEQDRIIYIEPKEKNAQTKNIQKDEEYYTQYRYVKIRFVRILGNPDEGVNVYQRIE